MSRIETFPEMPSRLPVRAAVLDLLALAAPGPAALGERTEEESEFLETLRRIVARSAAEDLWDRYHAPLADTRARVFARHRD